MVVVTYDEFGGQWDHVSPPGQGTATPGPHDQMGPSTRIPALVLAPGLRRGFSVDHASHDTTSIMATIEHRFRLRPVSTRDAAVGRPVDRVQAGPPPLEGMTASASISTSIPSASPTKTVVRAGNGSVT